MKRQHTTFSVEIKKSRTQAERHHLPPQRLFDVVPPPPEAPRIPRNEAVPKVAEPMAAPRILPSIVESKWGQSELAEPTRHKRSPAGKRGQMEFDLSAVSGDVNDAPGDTPVHAEVDLPAATAAPVNEDATSTPDAQPASGESAKSKARKVRKNVPAPVEPARANEPAPEVEPTRPAEMIGPSTAVESRSNERRLTRRLAAAVQLPRSERWKRRLHPASWRAHQHSTPV